MPQTSVLIPDTFHIPVCHHSRCITLNSYSRELNIKLSFINQSPIKCPVHLPLLVLLCSIFPHLLVSALARFHICCDENALSSFFFLCCLRFALSALPHPGGHTRAGLKLQAITFRSFRQYHIHSPGSHRYKIPVRKRTSHHQNPSSALIKYHLICYRLSA